MSSRKITTLLFKRQLYTGRLRRICYRYDLAVVGKGEMKWHKIKENAVFPVTLPSSPVPNNSEIPPCYFLFFVSLKFKLLPNPAGTRVRCTGAPADGPEYITAVYVFISCTWLKHTQTHVVHVYSWSH